MVQVQIKEVATSRGIKTSYQLMKLLAVPPGQAAKWFKNDIGSISLETLNKLCIGLECQPGDILVFTPDEPTEEALAGKPKKSRKK